MITSNDNINDNTKYVQGKMITKSSKFLRYHFPLYIFCAIIYVIIFRVLSFSLEHIWCYHLCYHLMLSFIVIISPSFFPWKRDTLGLSPSWCRISYVENFIIFWWSKCYHFDLLDGIIFHGVYVIIFEVLDVIILESLMLSFWV